MNKFKKIVAMLMVCCLFFSLSACSGHKDEYKSVRGFEFHFYPEEYEEEYNKVSKTLSLESDTEHQLQLEAVCESGTMEIVVTYHDVEKKVYSVNIDAPLSELLTISTNDTNEVTISISIEPDTKGKIIGDLLAQSK